MEEQRERIVWLGSCIAQCGTWLRVEKPEDGDKRFGFCPKHNVELGFVL